MKLIKPTLQLKLIKPGLQLKLIKLRFHMKLMKPGLKNKKDYRKVTYCL